MQLRRDKVAVVTGAASGIGFALADAFAARGLTVVLADIDESSLAAAQERLVHHDVALASVVTDVSNTESVNALANTVIERFGAVHVVCNNAGVGTQADPWFGPMSAWQWVLGVNLFGVINGVRAFLPHLTSSGEGYIINTASIAGLMPGAGASYDASKHAVVALTEDLYRTMRQMELPVGVSVLCPGWVRTRIVDAERNWPTNLGSVPPPGLGADVDSTHLRRGADAGMAPSDIAAMVIDAIEAERFWILPHSEFVEMAIHRWTDIANGVNPHDALEMSLGPRTGGPN